MSQVRQDNCTQDVTSTLARYLLIYFIANSFANGTEILFIARKQIWASSRRCHCVWWIEAMWSTGGRSQEFAAYLRRSAGENSSGKMQSWTVDKKYGHSPTMISLLLICNDYENPINDKKEIFTIEIVIINSCCKATGLLMKGGSRWNRFSQIENGYHIMYNI